MICRRPKLYDLQCRSSRADQLAASWPRNCQYHGGLKCVDMRICAHRLLSCDGYFLASSLADPQPAAGLI